MVQLTPPWKCDACGELITKAADGWFEWKSVRQSDGHTIKCEQFRIVHSPRANAELRCLYDQRALPKGTHIADFSLDKMAGGEGLLFMLSHINSGEFSTPEAVEIIRRLYIPGYEEVRQHLARAQHEGIFEPNTPDGSPDERDIRRIKDWLAAENERHSG